MTAGSGRQHKAATLGQMAMGAWGCRPKLSLRFQVGTVVLAW
jgi:hypothetical protein